MLAESGVVAPAPSARLRGRFKVFAAAIGIALLLTWTWVEASPTLVDFHPINGSFQNFNLLRRMAHGQILGVDFQTYLGLGVTHAMSLAMGDGQTLGDSLFAIRFLCGGLFIGCLLLLGYLARLTPLANVAMAAQCVLQATGLGPDFGLNPLAGMRQMYQPGNSVLGLRACLPFAIAALLLAVSATGPGQRLIEGRWTAPGLCGALAGIGLMWSNDYGFASAAALGGVTLLWLAGLPRALAAWRHAAAATLVFGSVAAVVGALSISAATHGHPIDWWNYNFRGVAADQFWYFQGQKLLQVTDLPAAPLVLWTLLSLGILLRDGFVTPTTHVTPKQLRTPLLAYILLSTILAGYVSSMGALGARYFAPAQLVATYTALYFLRLAWQDWKRRHPTRLAPKVCIGLGLCMVLASFVSAPMSVWQALRRTPDRGLHATSLWSGARPLAVPELGGDLSAQFDKMVALGRELGTSLRAAPPTSRIFSTYASALDVLAGAHHPTRHDYIIHALGPEARIDYTQKLLQHQPMYATTIREEFSPWETWLRRVNWDFYRVLLANYRPVDQTFYNTVWERHPGGVIDSWGAVQCTVKQDSDSRQTLTFAYTEQMKVRPEQVRFVEVTLTYRSRWRGNKLKVSRFVHGGLRQIQRVHEISTARSLPFGQGVGEENEINLPLALDSSTTARFLIEMHSAVPAVVRVVGEPGTMVELTIEACVAHDVAAKAAVDGFALHRLRAAARNDRKWRQGIAIGNGPAFWVSDASDLRGLRVGQHIRFAHSGLRTVRSVAGSQVDLDGPALDPVGDGYPHAITVEYR